MRTRMTLAVSAVAAMAIIAQIMLPTSSRAGKFRNPFRKKTTVEKLAKEIDDLEKHIDTYGSVVAKHPSVWGEARLTKHRHEFEKEMAKELDKFKETIQANIKRSDDAFLTQTLSISQAAAAASGGGRSNPNTVLGRILPGGSGGFTLLNVRS